MGDETGRSSTDLYSDKPSDGPRKAKMEEFGPTISMILIIGVMIVVITFVLRPTDAQTIVVESVGAQADFNATTALDYADRVSRIAEVTVGAVLTLALGLIGFNWLSNNARIERDREDLANHKTTLQNQFRVEVETNRRTIASLGQDLERLATVSIKNIEDKYTSLDERLNSHMASLPELIDRSLPRVFAGPNEVVRTMSTVGRILGQKPVHETQKWIVDFNVQFAEMFARNIHRTHTWKSIKDFVLTNAQPAIEEVIEAVEQDPELVPILDTMEFVSVVGYLRSIPGEKHPMEARLNHLSTALGKHHLKELYLEEEEALESRRRGNPRGTSADANMA